MTTRFFSFGCSFTNYHWPTWADILGREYDEFENWGSAGAGNHFIFYSLIEAIERKKINANDTIGIMWTSTHREDRWLRGKWSHTGSIYCSLLPKDYVDNWTDGTHYLMTSLALVAATKQILDAIGCRYWFFSMVPFDDDVEPSSNKPLRFSPQVKSDLLRLYRPVLDSVLPSFYETVFARDWNSRNPPMPEAKRRLIELFRQDYTCAADPTWPSFDDFLADNLSTVSSETRTRLDKNFNFFHRRDQVLQQRPDFHPIPAEHAEYLEHIGIELSAKQRAFVEYWDQKVATPKKYFFMTFPIIRF